LRGAIGIVKLSVEIVAFLHRYMLLCHARLSGSNSPIVGKANIPLSQWNSFLLYEKRLNEELKPQHI